MERFAHIEERIHLTPALNKSAVYIEEPHKLLHESAAEIINLMNRGENKKAEVLFKKLKNEAALPRQR